MPSQPRVRRAVSPGEAADLIGLGRTRTYEEIMSGRLRSFRIGRRRMISMTAIDQWIADREAESEADHADQR